MSFSQWWADWNERMKHTPESMRLQMKSFMQAAFEGGVESMKIRRERQPKREPKPQKEKLERFSL